MQNATLHPINQLNHRNVAISVLCLCERKDSFLYLFHVPGVAFSSSFYLIPPNHFTNKPDKWHGQCRAIASETLAYDLNNEWTAALSFSLVDSYAKIRIQRTCFECLYFVLFHLNVSLPLFLTLSEMSVLFSVCCCSFLVLYLRLTLTGLVSEITSAATGFFSSISFAHLYLIRSLLHSVYASTRQQSNRCLFALHYLYIYIFAHKYRL